MKLLIDISKEDYIRLRDEGMFGNVTTFKRAVREGIPLSESEDCVSRKAVNKIINKWLSHPDYELKDGIYDMTEKIHKLPPVTPAEKAKH